MAFSVFRRLAFWGPRPRPRPSETSVFRPRPGVTSVRVGDAVVVSDYEVYITLNDVSGRIWELIREERSVGQIVARLLEEYDVAVEILRPDVFAAIDRMLEAKLIEPTAP